MSPGDAAGIKAGAAADATVVGLAAAVTGSFGFGLDIGGAGIVVVIGATVGITGVGLTVVLLAVFGAITGCGEAFTAGCTDAGIALLAITVERVGAGFATAGSALGAVSLVNSEAIKALLQLLACTPVGTFSPLATRY